MEFFRRTYFLSVSGLVDAFKKNEITSEDVYRHLLVLGIIFPVGSVLAPIRLQPADLPNPSSAAADLATWVGYAVIFVFGLRYCYRKNTSPEKFLSRLVCLSLPIGIRLVLIGFVIAWLLLMFMPVFGEGAYASRVAISWSVFIFGGAMEIAYFLYMGSSLARIDDNVT